MAETTCCLPHLFNLQCDSIAFTMNPEYELLSFHILEKISNKTLVTWTFPSLSDKLKDALIEYVFNKDAVRFAYHRVDKQWVYIWERCKDDKKYALALITKCFNPTKYENFGTHLCSIYELTFKPIDLVQVFLGAFTNGSYKIQENGTQHNVNFAQIVHVSHAAIQEIVDLFGIEIILLYNAILLKRRVFVYCPDFSMLLKNLETITYLIDWKIRDPNEYLYPLVRNLKVELKGKHFFLAGFTDKNISIKPESYDVFVNIQTGVIKVSPNSKDIFQMTKWHKETAQLITNLATDAESNSNDSPCTELNKRTNELLINLRSFASAPSKEEANTMITMEGLRSKKLPIAMENFLFNLAVAENIMML